MLRYSSMFKVTLTRRNGTLFIGAALVCVAALGMFLASRPLLFAQDSAPPTPNLVGRWAVEARGYAYANVNDRPGKPMFQMVPAGGSSSRSRTRPSEPSPESSSVLRSHATRSSPAASARAGRSG